MSKAVDPEGNIGVYKRLSDVPSHYRLSEFAAEYEDRDVWAEHVEALHPEQTESLATYLSRFERRWKGHMADRGRHHALARPKDVEALCTELVADNTPETAYRVYWQRLERFYTWLQNHTDHPHVYHPPIMAAVEYPNARKLWDYRVSRTGVKQ